MDSLSGSVFRDGDCFLPARGRAVGAEHLLRFLPTALAAMDQCGWFNYIGCHTDHGAQWSISHTRVMCTRFSLGPAAGLLGFPQGNGRLKRHERRRGSCAGGIGNGVRECSEAAAARKNVTPSMTGTPVRPGLGTAKAACV